MKDFIKCFEITRMKVDRIDLEILFEGLADKNNGKLCTDNFWATIFGEIPENVKRVADYLWGTLDPRKEGFIHLTKLKNGFFGKFHPDVQNKKREQKDVENEFIRNLDIHNQLATTIKEDIDQNQFRDFVLNWLFVEDDEEDFLVTFVECFRLSEFMGEFNREKHINGLLDYGRYNKSVSKKKSRSRNDSARNQDSSAMETIMIGGGGDRYREEREEVKNSRKKSGFGNSYAKKNMNRNPLNYDDSESRRSNRGRGKSSYAPPVKQKAPWDFSDQPEQKESYKNNLKFDKRREINSRSVGIFGNNNSDLRRSQKHEVAKKHFKQRVIYIIFIKLFLNNYNRINLC